MNLKTAVGTMMKNVFIINAAKTYDFAPGKLTAEMVNRASNNLESKGYDIRTTIVQESYDIEEEIEKHQWADVVLLQTPIHWMEFPWVFKKYMDEVYTVGMDGRLSSGDGRSRKDPSKQYGSGGSLAGTKYCMSLTFNAPKAAFNDPDQFLFGGKSVDDLVFPMHVNFKFFNMEPLAKESFACFDVLKNPNIEEDFVKFENYLDENFPNVHEPTERN